MKDSRAHEVKFEGTLEEDLEKFKNTVQNTSKGRDDEFYSRIIRIGNALKCYDEYLDYRKPTRCADNLEKWLNFISLKTLGSNIDRLTLFSFEKYYKPDGEILVNTKLYKVRKDMLKRSNAIHKLYDGKVKKHIDKLSSDLQNINDNHEKREVQEKIKNLKEFLSLPGDLELRNSAMNEISNRLKSRNRKGKDELNQPPKDGIFRMALIDCTIEGVWDGSSLNVTTGDFNPDHLLTYALHVNIRNPNILGEAREWWNFSVQTMGVEGTKKFYEMVGYLLIVKYPLPTERNIMVLIGDSGSGKGTHLGAIEAMLTMDDLVLFAKAGPHKLADQREHFSKQNLQNKLALLKGDLSHSTIHDFSEVNDIFGGEPTEMEQKFKDPTMERQTFKGIWASAPPLFKITQAGGAWRRINLIALKPPFEKDNSTKPKLLRKIDGFFLNGLLGLSYLISNNWQFTGELENDEIEKLWSFHSDSIQVWAQKLVPESEENEDTMIVIDELYERYESWAKNKQIEPVKPKSFSSWLGKHGFKIVQRTIEKGEFNGKRKKVTFVTWLDENDLDAETKENHAAPELPWESYYSCAPLTFKLLHDSIGQLPHHESVLKSDYNNVDHVNNLPDQIVQEHVISQEARTSGSNYNLSHCTIPDQDSKAEEFVNNDRSLEDLSKSNPESIQTKAKITDAHGTTLDQAFTKETGNKLVEFLLNKGYHLKESDTGVSIYRNKFNIALPSTFYKRKSAEIDLEMKNLGFVRGNRGEFGVVFFSRPLIMQNA